MRVDKNDYGTIIITLESEDVRELLRGLAESLLTGGQHWHVGGYHTTIWIRIDPTAAPEIGVF